MQSSRNRGRCVDDILALFMMSFGHAEAGSVPGFMAGVGRMAAQIAMEPTQRRSVVDPSDFLTAFQVVKADHDSIQPLGKWCL